MDSKIVLSSTSHTEGRTPGRAARAVMFGVGVRCIVFASDFRSINRSFVYTIATMFLEMFFFCFQSAMVVTTLVEVIY